MKIITPSVIAELHHEPEHMKIFKTGICFNRSAQKLLALKQDDRFLILQDDKGRLYYQETLVPDSFKIGYELIKGGCRSQQKYLLEYLFPEQKNPSITFSIGEPVEGRRLLTPIGFEK